MVEKVIIQLENIRADGNILEGKSVEDYTRYESSLVKSTVNINGVPISSYILLYSPNNFAFDFDSNLKQLYVSEDEDTVEVFTFDTTNKRLSLSSDVVNFGFDDTLNCLYCDNEYSSLLFYDVCDSADNLINYDNAISVYNASLVGSPVLAYDSTENAYSLSGTSTQDWAVFPIPALEGENDFTISMEMKVNTSAVYPYFGFAVFPSESSLDSIYADLFYSFRYSSSSGIYTSAQRRRISANESISAYYDSSFDFTEWFKLTITFDDNDGVTATWKTLDGTIINTVTTTVSASTSDRHYGLFLRGNTGNYGFIRNIQALRNE